jgi:hypothetical protein
MTQKALANKILSNPDLQNKLKILSLAEKINPKFKNPNICGGYLRDLVLEASPSDCDVFFDGYMKNQHDILECVREAEKQLKIAPYTNWEFENFNVSCVTGDLYEDTIGFYSNHTDYLTLILCDTDGNVRFGSEDTISCLNAKIYDIRYQGLMVWTGFRDRTYYRSLAGLACRGMYLCHKLNLNPADSAIDLFKNFDFNYGKLTDDEKVSLLAYWNKKTRNISDIQLTLDRFNVKNLNPAFHKI